MYDGGKNGSGVAQWIINQIPPHQVYIEAFTGSATIARLKRPAERTILIEADRAQAERLQNEDGWVVMNGDALHFLPALGNLNPAEAKFIYCDPPYLFSTRSGGTSPIYKHEFGTAQQHRQLLSLLLTIAAPIAISGYASPLYAEMLHGWRCTTFNTTKRSGAPATECLWMNYPEPTRLHDYSFLGANFRERERIKRKQARWRHRLATMNATERYAMLSVIGEL